MPRSVCLRAIIGLVTILGGALGIIGAAISSARPSGVASAAGKDTFVYFSARTASLQARHGHASRLALTGLAASAGESVNSGKRSRVRRSEVVSALKTAHYVDLFVTPKNHSQRLKHTFEVRLSHVTYSRSGALAGDAEPVRNGGASDQLGAVEVEALAAASSPPRGGSPGYYVPVNFHVQSGVPAGAKVSVSMYFPTCAEDIGKREFTLGAVPETVSWKFGVINDSFRCFTTTTKITYDIYLSAPGDGFWAAGVEAVQRFLSKDYNADSRGCGAASPSSQWESTCEYTGGEAINIYFKTRHK